MAKEKKPRTLAEIAAHPAVKEVWRDPHDNYGLDVQLKPGWQWGGGEHRVLVRNTLKEVLKFWPPVPCDCQECQQEKESR